MGWTKGKKRGAMAIPPDFMRHDGGNLAEVVPFDDGLPRGKKSFERRLLGVQALCDYVESGEHLIAERYHPGDKLKAERAYRVLQVAKNKLVAGNHSANKARSDERRGVLSWIKLHCAEILKNRRLSKKTKIRAIELRMQEAGKVPPSIASMYRYINDLVGEKSNNT